MAAENVSNRKAGPRTPGHDRMMELTSQKVDDIANQDIKTHESRFATNMNWHAATSNALVTASCLGYPPSGRLDCWRVGPVQAPTWEVFRQGNPS